MGPEQHTRVMKRVQTAIQNIVINFKENSFVCLVTKSYNSKQKKHNKKLKVFFHPSVRSVHLLQINFARHFVRVCHFYFNGFQFNLYSRLFYSSPYTYVMNEWRRRKKKYFFEGIPSPFSKDNCVAHLPV